MKFMFVIVLSILVLSACTATGDMTDFFGFRQGQITEQVRYEVAGQVQINKDTLASERKAEMQTIMGIILFFLISCGFIVAIAKLKYDRDIKIAQALGYDPRQPVVLDSPKQYRELQQPKRQMQAYKERNGNR